MSGGRAPESCKWFPFVLSRFTNGRPCIFLPRISQKKDYNVKFQSLANSLQSPFPEHPLLPEVMNGQEVCLIVLFSTYSYQTGRNGVITKASTLLLTPNVTFIFILKTESSLSFGRAI